MDRSSEERTLRQVNGRTRLEVNLNEPRAQLESLATRLDLYTNITDGTFEAMATNYTPRIEALENKGEALEAWRITGDTKILTLQEFDLISNDDLRNLHILIVNAAENTSNDIGALSKDLGGHIGALSNDFGDRIGALSNDLAGRIDALSNDLGGRIVAFSNDVGAILNDLVTNCIKQNDAMSYEDLIDKPVQVILAVWVNNIQEDVPLSNFGGSLDYIKIINTPLPAE